MRLFVESPGGNGPILRSPLLIDLLEPFLSCLALLFSPFFTHSHRPRQRLLLLFCLPSCCFPFLHQRVYMSRIHMQFFGKARGCDRLALCSLLLIGSSDPFGTLRFDALAAFRRPCSILRRKLVLMLLPEQRGTSLTPPAQFT